MALRHETLKRLREILKQIDVPRDEKSVHVWVGLMETITHSAEELDRCDVAMDLAMRNIHLSEKLISNLLHSRVSSAESGVWANKAYSSCGQARWYRAGFNRVAII